MMEEFLYICLPGKQEKEKGTRRVQGQDTKIQIQTHP
jgi:hypothetical protein